MSEYIVRESGYPGQLKQEIVGELVRCKDCRYFAIVNQPYDQTWCEVMHDSVKPDGYCYKGERKDGLPHLQRMTEFVRCEDERGR